MKILPQTLLRRCRRRAAAVYKAAIGRPTSRDPISITEADDVARALIESRAVLANPLVVTVPVERLRDGIGRSFCDDHPFVDSLYECASEDASSILTEYYRVCQCTTAIEVMGVTASKAPGFNGLPAASFVMPWYRIDPETISARRERFAREAGRRYGMDLTLADGQNLFGPVSAQKSRLEYQRLRTLRDSMQASGYRRGQGADGDISGELLVDEHGGWCVRVRWGLHRTAVAVRLGYNALPIRFEHPPVLRTSVAIWPQVRAGRMTVEGALEVFDRFVEGLAPATCSSWRGAPVGDNPGRLADQ